VKAFDDLEKIFALCGAEPPKKGTPWEKCGKHTGKLVKKLELILDVVWAAQHISCDNEFDCGMCGTDRFDLALKKLGEQ
jgi:hypothetical protein